MFSTSLGRELIFHSSSGTISPVLLTQNPKWPLSHPAWRVLREFNQVYYTDVLTGHNSVFFFKQFAEVVMFDFDHVVMFFQIMHSLLLHLLANL